MALATRPITPASQSDRPEHSRRYAGDTPIGNADHNPSDSQFDRSAGELHRGSRTFDRRHALWRMATYACASPSRTVGGDQDSLVRSPASCRHGKPDLIDLVCAVVVEGAMCQVPPCQVPPCQVPPPGHIVVTNA
jgi:hypothetical protein